MGINQLRSIDWEAIEREYRAGIRSLREIAEQFGITHGAIRKRAARDGWKRDLSAKIRAEADALVARGAASTVSAEDEQDIVRAGAELQASIVREHRKDIQRNRSLATSLLAELEAQTGKLELYDQLGELLFSPNGSGVDKLNELYRKVIALPSRIDSAKKLAETLKVLVGMERKAFGIADDVDGNKKAPDQSVTIYIPANGR